MTCSIGAVCLPFDTPGQPPDIDELAVALKRGASETKLAGGNKAAVYKLADYA